MAAQYHAGKNLISLRHAASDLVVQHYTPFFAIFFPISHIATYTAGTEFYKMAIPLEKLGPVNLLQDHILKYS